jgi:uncharacterized SAM-binding protein YcdF (DUF218 family)
MSLQGVTTTLFLPPLLFCILGLGAALLAAVGRRGPRRLLAIMCAGCFLGLLLLATPFVAGHLAWSLSRGMRQAVVESGIDPPRAIIVLSAERARSARAPEVGPLTLERLRAAAALARRTGLPLLASGGITGPEDPPLAALMGEALAADFAQPARWLERDSRDTRENAVLSARMLRAEGIGAAYVVTHAWHMPRTLEAFQRAGFTAYPWPVRADRPPSGRATDWVPRPDHLYMSWLALREWVGRLVYALRDPEAPGQRQ